MKPLRIFYIAILAASMISAFVFFYHFQLRGEELARYRELNKLSSAKLERLTAKLAESKKELEISLGEVARLNKIIARLGQDSANFGKELEVLRQERDQLKKELTQLAEEKSILGIRLHSPEELERVIRIARRTLNKKRKMERANRRSEKIAMLKALDQVALVRGNNGFLLKDSRTTFKATRIEVELEPARDLSRK